MRKSLVSFARQRKPTLYHLRVFIFFSIILIALFTNSLQLPSPSRGEDFFRTNRLTAIEPASSWVDLAPPQVAVWLGSACYRIVE
jgi:hypothetical protein